MIYYCRGICQVIAPDLFLMILQVNNLLFELVSDTGSCHEAAYMAQAIALRIAKQEGLKTVIIENTNRHVVYQLRGEWRTRRPVMRRGRDACRALATGLDVQYRVG